MTRLDRTEALADAYDEAGRRIDCAIEAIENGDREGAEAAMRAVVDVMDEIKDVIVSGPILPLIQMH